MAPSSEPEANRRWPARLAAAAAAVVGAALAVYWCWDWWRFADSPVHRLPSGSGPPWVRYVPGLYFGEAALAATLAAWSVVRGAPGRSAARVVGWSAAGVVATIAVVGHYSAPVVLQPAAGLLGFACLLGLPPRWRGMLWLLLAAALQIVVMVLVSQLW